MARRDGHVSPAELPGAVLSRAGIGCRISLLESLSAMSWSLSNTLTQRGYPIPLSEEDAAYMRLTPFRIATLWLKDRGTPAVSADEAQASWRFTIETQSDDVFSLALTLAGGTPEHISKVGVRSSTSEADLIVPYPAYALFTQWPADKAAPHEHLVAVIELRNLCMKGNHSLLTDGDLKHATGCMGLLLISGDQSVIPSLRKVLRMARDHRWAMVKTFASKSSVSGGTRTHRESEDWLPSLLSG